MARTLSFAAGDTVAIKGEEGNIVVAPQWGNPTSNISVTIEAGEHPDKVAPFGVFFEAHVSGWLRPEPEEWDVREPEFHDLLYKWTFSTQGEFTTPLRFSGALAAWKSRSEAEGPHVGHVFDAGPQWARVEVFNNIGSKIAEATWNTNVADPMDYFPAARRIVVSKTGDFSGAPEASTQVSNYLEALAALRGLGNKGAIFFRRGEDYRDNAPTWENAPKGVLYHNIYLSAWGAGDPPRLPNYRAREIGPEGQGGFVLAGIHLCGNWDPTTESGGSGGANGLENQEPTGPITFWGGKISNLGCLVRGSNTGGSLLIVHNTEMLDWSDIGYIGVNPWRSFAGCVVWQNPQALAGGGGSGTNNNQNRHGPERLGNRAGMVQKLHIERCDIFSNSGWSAQAGITPYGQTAAYQACWRYSSGDRNYRLNYNRCILEGGTGIIGMTATGDHPSFNARPGNILLRKIVLIGNAGTTRHLGVNLGGVTAENIYFVMPDCRQLFGFRRFAALFGKVPVDDPDNDRTLSYLSGITGVSDLTGANAAAAARDLIVAYGRPAGRIAAALVHAPGHPQSKDAGAMEAVAEIPTLFRSFQQQGKTTEPDTSFASPETVTIYQPAVGNPLRGSLNLTSQAPVDDLLGRFRGLENITPGALNPPA